MKSQRAVVFAAIDTEREYQKLRWGDRELTAGGVPVGFKERNQSLGDYLTYIRHHLAVAEAQLTTSNDDVSCREALRKVVALGVAALEQHGVIERELGLVWNRDEKIAADFRGK